MKLAHPVKFTLFLLSVIVIVSCSQEKQKTNDCDYETNVTLAEVVNLKPHPAGNGRISVVLDFKESGLSAEEQELGELKDVSIDHDYLDRNRIEIGNKYEVTVSELIKGDCTTKLTVAFHHSFE